MIEDVILTDLKTMAAGDRGHHALYYWQGNFYHPLDLHGGDFVRVKKAIRQFVQANKERVTKDRSDPQYKTVLELFDEQATGC